MMFNHVYGETAVLSMPLEYTLILTVSKLLIKYFANCNKNNKTIFTWQCLTPHLFFYLLS